MDVNQVTSIHESFLQQSEVKYAEQEQDKRGKSNQPQDYMVQETENSIGYSVEISPDGMQKAEDADNESRKATDKQSDVNQLENVREQGKAAAESWEVRIKCLQIAMRIIVGDEVPVADHRYLAKNDPELYYEAMSRRVPSENPRKHEKLSEDEKPDNPNTDNTSDDSPALSASANNNEIEVESGEQSENLF